MARRLPQWHWIRTVRAHGPTVASIRAVLLALAIRMDDRGEAFPSQRTIARDTALSERTVRDALLEARRTSWLAAKERGGRGRAWRHLHYYACVPDHLDLSQIDLGRGVDLEKMAEYWASQEGDILDPMHGLPRAPGRRGAKARSAKGAAICASGTATGAGRPETRDTKVRQPSPTKSPSKFPGKDPHEGRAPMRTPGDGRSASDSSMEHGTQPEPKTSNSTDSGQRNNLSEVVQETAGRNVCTSKSAKLDPDIARRKVHLVHRERPDFLPAEIALVTGVPLETVQAILLDAA